jgi:predicted MFS family arabinose efflux permease
LLTLLFDVAYEAYLPALVRREDLLEGNSKLTASAAVAEFGGFSLAGWLVQWLTGPFTILIDAISFLFSAGAMAFIRTRESAPTPAAEHEANGVWREIVAGLRIIRQDTVLPALGLTHVTFSLGQGMVGAIIVLFMVDGLHFSPGVLGMIWAVGGVTSFLGAAFAAATAQRLGTGLALAAGIVLAGVGTLFVPLAPGPTAIGVLLMIGNQLVTDPAYTMYTVNEVSLRQRIVPDRLLGRVGATFRFGGLGATLLGSFLGGILGERLGLRPTLVTGALLSASAAVCLLAAPALRRDAHLRG